MSVLRRAPSLGSIVLLVLLVIVLISGAGEDDGGEGDPAGELSGDPQGGVVVAVREIVDGDTIHVELEGADESVRYIGVDTPEVDPSIGVECFGSDASDFNRDLVSGEEVRLVFDAERRDRYGRLLAYIYRQPDELFVNAELIRLGFARTLTIEPNDSFALELGELEDAARDAGLGLWGECG